MNCSCGKPVPADLATYRKCTECFNAILDGVEMRLDHATHSRYRARERNEAEYERRMRRWS